MQKRTRFLIFRYLLTVGLCSLGAATLLGAKTSLQQPMTPQNPSPMVEHTRPHPRASESEPPGRRIELKTLKGARLFVSPGFSPAKPAGLLIHFHGAPWLIEQHVERNLSKTVLITVQLGSGSSAYRRPFLQPDLFKSLVTEARQELELKQEWSSITLSGFSAGYGAVREILRRPEYFASVNNVLLLDGMHTSYSPEGKLLAEGGLLEESGLDVFVKLAREAVAGRKGFVLTHSEIFPGAYASTTECADYLLAQLKLKRKPHLRRGPLGMQQLSAVDNRGFHLRGYAGNTAPDHVDHLQAMPTWFRLLHLARH
jgi:hypothetical protein